VIHLDPNKGIFDQVRGFACWEVHYLWAAALSLGRGYCRVKYGIICTLEALGMILGPPTGSKASEASETAGLC